MVMLFLVPLLIAIIVFLAYRLLKSSTGVIKAVEDAAEVDRQNVVDTISNYTKTRRSRAKKDQTSKSE